MRKDQLAALGIALLWAIIVIGGITMPSGNLQANLQLVETRTR